MKWVVIKIVEIFTNNQLYRGRGLEYNHERPCFVSVLQSVLLPLCLSLMQSLTPSMARACPAHSSVPTHEQFSLSDEFLIHHCFYLEVWRRRNDILLNVRG